MKSNTSKYIFSEDFDYSQVSPNSSIWGDGDKDTIKVLEELVQAGKFFGNWLNFAAGDGRYNNLLLTVADQLVATDIDLKALNKLKKLTPRKLLSKLLTKKQDITKKFNFVSQSFSGVFNTGTLHLFPELVLELIFSEIARILKNNGLFIFDFATDVERVKADGSLIDRSKEQYTKLSAKRLLTELLTQNGFKFEFIACKVPPEEVTTADGAYLFSCNYWLVVAEKIYD